MWLLISAVVAVASFYALFAGYRILLLTVSPFLHPIPWMVFPAYILSSILGLLFGRWPIVAIAPMAYVAALAVFWLTLCSHCDLDIGLWQTYGLFALLGLPTFIAAGLGTWIRVLATNRG
jgi:hypothetical protein